MNIFLDGRIIQTFHKELNEEDEEEDGGEALKWQNLLYGNSLRTYIQSNKSNVLIYDLRVREGFLHNFWFRDSYRKVFFVW